VHTPRKRFGQHFLQDQAVIQQIIAALSPKRDEHIVEIGPGQGALTLPLLPYLDQLEVIELDRDLIVDLAKRGGKALEIHAADALTFDFASLKKDERMLRVLGNLPYNISTPLMFHLLSFAPIISDMLFMLQKEVAYRLAAKANDDHYGRLSVMTQYHCQVDVLFDVPATAFYPPPQVESSIVRLVPHRHYPALAQDPALFAALVKQAFGQRRKTLRNSLSKMVTDTIWQRTQIDSHLRPENLSVKDFVALANIISEIG